jgi:hypothetical protein
MFDDRSRRTAVLLLVPAAVAGASLAGCSGSSSRPADASLSAKGAAGAFSAAKLRGALLTRVNGVGAATPVVSGRFSSLSAAETGERSAGDVKAAPKDCAQATQTGLDPTVLAESPAAAVTFKVDANGVSEVLVSLPDNVTSTALAGRLPAACAHFKETIDGKTLTYTATETALTGIGKQARVLNVQSSAGGADDLWSLVYRGKGFVGAVTVVGPNASEAAVRELGQQAYTYADKSLS